VLRTTTIFIRVFSFDPERAFFIVIPAWIL